MATDGRASTGREGSDEKTGIVEEGRHEFSFTYDDTGNTATVTAPNGWTMQRVIEEGYSELEEGAKPDDRVEFDGILMTVELRALKVKEFVARHPKGKFHIVSKPGGAVCTQVANGFGSTR